MNPIWKIAIAAISIVMAVTQSADAAVKFKRLYAFTGGTDGGNPSAFLIPGDNGTFYGTTEVGGASNHGTVFRLAPPAPGKTKWTETVLHSFTGADGAVPYAKLVSDGTGGFFGATNKGGAGDFGTIFRLSPPAPGATVWNIAVLYSFTAGANPDHRPYAELIVAHDGIVYGTTRFGGGTCDCGTVFQLTAPAPGATGWDFTVLHAFDGYSGLGDGAHPQNGLALGAGNFVYGAALDGGRINASSCPVGPFDPNYSRCGLGLVFQISPPAAGNPRVTIIHTFDGSMGGEPRALTTDASGAIYVDTGALVRLTPPANGASPWSPAIVYRYGIHVDDGAYAINTLFDRTGTIFASRPDLVLKVTPATASGAWTRIKLKRFSGTALGGIGAIVPDGSGVLYGTLWSGGPAKYICQAASACGSVYQMTGSGFMP